LLGFNLRNLTQSEKKIFMIGESLSKWKNNGAGFKARCSHLVKQGLETMVIIFIEKHCLGFKSVQPFSHFKATKTPADNNDPGFAQVSDSGSRGDQFGHEFFGAFKTGANLTSFT
jgi:hypothetical protein